MRKGRFSEEQIINVPKEHQAGIPIVECAASTGSAPLAPHPRHLTRCLRSGTLT